MKDTTQDGSPEVLYEVSDAIATITLNRPERMNTISGPMLGQLSALLLQADKDPSVRAIILTATGPLLCGAQRERPQTAPARRGQHALSDAPSPVPSPSTSPRRAVLFNLDSRSSAR